MKTPVIDFVKKYAESDSRRAHMPGHKGQSFLGFEKYDITEIEGADVLYHADGILKESMQNASSLFGTAKTLYSTEGSSLSIRAMLYLAKLYALEKGVAPTILAFRNAHKVFVTACAMLDIEVDFLYGDGNGVTECIVAPEALDNVLSSTAEKPCAVYVTSPDYLGNIADIQGLSAVCKKHGVLLLADNAHGAYLGFLSENMHPIHLGADICCDSAHKTLPCLTGAGYLHISKNAPSLFLKNAEKAMAMFASTSPSYLILQSLDGANKYLSESYRERLFEYCEKIKNLKERLCALGYNVRGNEPLKLTFSPKEFGYYGTELAEYLSERGIVCEFCDPDFTVLMLTIENGNEILSYIYRAMSELLKRPKICEAAPKITSAKRGMSAREALFSTTCRISVENSVGRVYAGACVSCPPAIPIVVCGEIITDEAVEALLYYGETEVEVVV